MGERGDGKTGEWVDRKTGDRELKMGKKGRIMDGQKQRERGTEIQENGRG
jgi:hypothetical protein